MGSRNWRDGGLQGHLAWWGWFRWGIFHRLCPHSGLELILWLLPSLRQRGTAMLLAPGATPCDFVGRKERKIGGGGRRGQESQKKRETKNEPQSRRDGLQKSQWVVCLKQSGLTQPIRLAQRCSDPSGPMFFPSCCWACKAHVYGSKRR